MVHSEHSPSSERTHERYVAALASIHCENEGDPCEACRAAVAPYAEKCMTLSTYAVRFALQAERDRLALALTAPRFRGATSEGMPAVLVTIPDLTEVLRGAS